MNIIANAINAIAERPGTSILGLTYNHPTDGIKEYNLRAGDARVLPEPANAKTVNRVAHIAGTGNTLLRVIDHNNGELPKGFNLDRIVGIRCGAIKV